MNLNELQDLLQSPAIQELPVRMGGDDQDRVAQLTANVVALEIIQLGKTALQAHREGLEEIDVKWGVLMSRMQGRCLFGSLRVEGDAITPFDRNSPSTTDLHTPGVDPALVEMRQSVSKVVDNRLMRSQRPEMERIFSSPFRSIQDCERAMGRIDGSVRAEFDRLILEQDTEVVLAVGRPSRMRASPRR